MPDSQHNRREKKFRTGDGKRFEDALLLKKWTIATFKEKSKKANGTIFNWLDAETLNDKQKSFIAKVLEMDVVDIFGDNSSSKNTDYEETINDGGWKTGWNSGQPEGTEWDNINAKFKSYSDIEVGCLFVIGISHQSNMANKEILAALRATTKERISLIMDEVTAVKREFRNRNTQAV